MTGAGSLTIAAAQPACVPSDVVANAAAHAEVVRHAGARVVVFPELSLTGYELDAPAVDPGDGRLRVLVNACAAAGAVALVGAPTAGGDGRASHLSVLAVDGEGARVAYRKMWLSDVEAKRFTPGSAPTVIEVDGWRLGLAVCKDTGVDAHAAATAALGIDAYVAGVLESADDADVPGERARRITEAHHVWVVVAGFAGATGGGYDRAAGRSRIWAPDGVLVADAGTDVGGVARATLTRGTVLPSTRTEVRRVGDTVVRSGGPWTPAVHALLRHLEAVGFRGSPRVIGEGVDSEGRERLSFLAGEPVHPHGWSDAGIAELGRLLRELHDAGSTFRPPRDAEWQPWFTRADGPHAVFGHGDLGPWNIVARDGLPVGFIDWEFAGPVDRLGEVAQAGWLNAQLHEDIVAGTRLPSAEQRARQLRLFVDAYGLDGTDRARLVARIVDHAVRDAGDEVTMAGGLKMAKAPIDPSDPGSASAWRIRSAAWLAAHRRLLESALESP